MIIGIYLILLTLNESAQEWQASGTEIYRPLVTREVALSPSGQVFIVHRDEAKILRFDRNGKQLPSFSQKGQGPGELSLPTWLHLQDKLYVQDAATASISIFTLDGTFIKRLSLPESKVTVKKLVNGWVYGNWGARFEPGKQVTLYWSDHEFGNQVKLLTWPATPEKSNQSIEVEGSGKPSWPLNPAIAHSHLTVNATRTMAYLTQKGSSAIHVIDAKQKKIVHVIKNSYAPTLFNKEWGMAEVDKAKDNMKNLLGTQDLPFKIVPTFPDHFPLVRSLQALPGGELALSKWTALPEKRQDFIVFDLHHKKVQSPFSARALGRMIGIQAGWAWITTYHDEEAGIARIKIAKVNSYVADHPIDYEGLSGNAVVNLSK